MSTPLALQSLDDVLTPLFPDDVQGWGRWAWLAERCGVSRASVSEWLGRGLVPALRVDAVCDLLTAPPEVRAELRRRAGFQVIAATEIGEGV